MSEFMFILFWSSSSSIREVDEEKQSTGLSQQILIPGTTYFLLHTNTTNPNHPPEVGNVQPEFEFSAAAEAAATARAKAPAKANNLHLAKKGELGFEGNQQDVKATHEDFIDYGPNPYNVKTKLTVEDVKASIPDEYRKALEKVEKRGWAATKWDRGYTLLHWAALNCTV